MDNRRHSRHSATRVAAAVAQEAICTIMSSSADHEFEMSLQSYGNNMTSCKSSRTATKRDSHGDVISSFTDAKMDNLGTKIEINSSGHGIMANNNSAINSLALTPKRESMFDAYQHWALKTYGDSAKTKTVTKKKYNRIIKILKGEESTNVENSKFRFWVKAKGFRLGPQQLADTDSKAAEQVLSVLYVPCSKTQGSDRDETIYKKVAVVENFFDIIYNVHVEMDGRSGRHAGQKRTYKAVAEMYAFLPREAVTRFLMSCSDCQKRMHLQGTNGTNGSCNGITATSKNSSKSSVRTTLQQHSSDGPKTTLDIDYSLPLTTTIKRMRNAGFVYNVMGDSLIAPTACLNFDGQDVDEEMISETEGASDADISAHNGDQTTAANSDDALCEEITGDDDDDDDDEEEVLDEADFDEEAVPLDMSRVKCENSVCFDQPLNMSSKRAKLSTSKIGSNSAENGSLGSVATHGLQERWTHNTNRIVAEDEEEDDEDDNDLQLGDRLLTEQSNSYDPERLKAFNMFVRLFVDENLDRMVPISRQPKEKIQAIIESCTRQFPEFSERARKRIRTYLKSCRRTKRHKTTATAGGNENGRAWNESSQTNTKTGTSNHVSYHLTSPMAEQILATACDNECQNAKRMRMGLKPISNEVSSGGNSTVHTCNPTSTSASAVQVFQQNATNPNLLTFPYQPSISGENGSTITNGANVSSNSKSPANGSHYSLNPSEVAAVKQLIAGYRESAAFLLRSADELEQLILQQN